MTLAELQHLANQGEGLKIEFKRKVAFPIKICREVVAFANTVGGKLIIGVNDDGNLSGCKFPEEEQLELEKHLKIHCTPPISYEVTMVRLNSKKGFVVFDVPESAQKPHFLLKETKHKWGKAYYRIADKSIQASRELREVIRLRSLEVDTQFTYGELESEVLKLAEENQMITVSIVQSQTHCSYQEASAVLIKLTLANVLKIKAREIEDHFTLS